jgi:hypothetical protein
MKVAKAVDTVLGYVVLHRHGHRAPIRNLFEKNEIDLWCNLLPSSERLQQLSKSYPIQSHSGNVPPIDLKYKPLSCLTDLGVNHMISVGKKTNELFPLMNQSAKFQVFSTNYHRTQVIILELMDINHLVVGECSIFFNWIGGHSRNPS